MPFTETDLISAANELTRSNQSGWQSYMTVPSSGTQGEFIVQRRVSGRNPALFEYLAQGTYADVPASVLAQIYLDLEYRKTWDKNMLSYRSLAQKGAFHFAIKYPWPLSNRDYCYEIAGDWVNLDAFGNVFVIVGDSIVDPECPVEKGIIRIDSYWQKVIIKPIENGGCEIIFAYFDDPKGTIPTTVINWVAKTGVPLFIKSLHDASLKWASDHPGWQKEGENTKVITKTST